MKKGNRRPKNAYPAPRREHFPEDEAALDWLSMLFDAYHESDKSVYQSIAAERTIAGRRIACCRGCSSCCKTHLTIPVYPLELLGLYWFVLEKVAKVRHEILVRQLLDFKPGKGCPFMTHDACGVHPVRPMACRFFNVFGAPCKEGEDPFYTRREDVMTPDEKGKNKALSLMLPHHGISQRAERREAVKQGYMHRYAKNLQNINWPKVAIRLRNGDRQPLHQA